jgi:hypothetical protein
VRQTFQSMDPRIEARVKFGVLGLQERR